MLTFAPLQGVWSSVGSLTGCDCISHTFPGVRLHTRCLQGQFLGSFDEFSSSLALGSSFYYHHASTLQNHHSDHRDWQSLPPRRGLELARLIEYVRVTVHLGADNV